MLTTIHVSVLVEDPDSGTELIKWIQIGINKFDLDLAL